MRNLLILVSLLFVFTACQDNEIKTTKDYSSIKSELDYDDFEELVYKQPSGMRLRDFVNNVGIANAEYDKRYTVNVFLVPWVFHLGNVRLDLQIERLEDGYHLSELYTPIVTYDNMTRQERMDSYYKHMGKLIKQKNKKLKDLDEKYFKQ